MTIKQYIDSVNSRYKLGNATEHTFRSDLQVLIEALLPGIKATNEPKRMSCGAPDYILTKKEIPIAYIEAKDIGDKDLEGLRKAGGNKEQFDRYKASLESLIITDYIHFHFYRNGELLHKVSIAEVTDKGIKALPENFADFERFLADFTAQIGQTIKSSKKLAEMMAAKARLLADIIEKAVESDEANQDDSSLKDQMIAFKEILIHDIRPRDFADVYAQTIAYGMFAARLHDDSIDNFTRQEAAELIPKSNPFLRKLFGYIAGPDIDDRIKWIVDSLADVFLACNIKELLKDFGKATKTEDPIIHFYETFLSEYDPKLRKSRGVWYTPAPVVNFIVRAVDDILKTEFGLPQGLADNSKTTIKLNTQNPDRRSTTGYKQIEQEVHRVQILDPATGTGTFLAEVVKLIHKKFEGQQGIWSNYVENHLLPRLNGFELLMASYAMAHLKLDLLLGETGYKPSSNQRFRVYLTNSLEESHPDTGTLFANWLSAEANEANHIKRDTPVMCVIGNPPYSGISANNGEWISNLIEDYKYVNGVHFNERKHWLNDDYVKFLRYGQYFIEKNGSGVLAFINPHGFLENPTFRGMRWHLLKTYDKIYTIDLHGNSKKKETTPDGSADINVFDIQQGVSINIFVKTGKKKPNELGIVFHFDLYGKRELKYDFLTQNSLHSTSFNKIEYSEPYYFFVPKNEKERIKYEEGFKIVDLLPLNTSGFASANDDLNISFTMSEQKQKIKELLELEEPLWRVKYNKKKDSRDWQYLFAKNDAVKNLDISISPVAYRPFDTRFSLYTGKSRGLYASPQPNVMRHLTRDNISINLVKRSRSGDFVRPLVSYRIVDKSIVSTLDNANVFPLYLYPEANGQQTIEPTLERTPNLNLEIVNQIAEKIGLRFINEKEATEHTFAPIDLLDYIYAVLHSTSYREKYKEFLKIDFPRVPYPKDAETFWKLVALGGQIRQIHLLESPVVEQYITRYPVDGTNEVDRLKYEDGKVFINETQYFDQVPAIAWNFYIGGYQPAQKWLKDRKGRQLSFEDIMHYQKIIVALTETDRLMNDIDEVWFIKES